MESFLYRNCLNKQFYLNQGKNYFIKIAMVKHLEPKLFTRVLYHLMLLWQKNNCKFSTNTFQIHMVQKSSKTNDTLKKRRTNNYMVHSIPRKPNRGLKLLWCLKPPLDQLPPIGLFNLLIMRTIIISIQLSWIKLQIDQSFQFWITTNKLWE